MQSSELYFAASDYSPHRQIRQPPSEATVGFSSDQIPRLNPQERLPSSEERRRIREEAELILAHARALLDALDRAGSEPEVTAIWSPVAGPS